MLGTYKCIRQNRAKYLKTIFLYREKSASKWKAKYKFTMWYESIVWESMHMDTIFPLQVYIVYKNTYMTNRISVKYKPYIFSFNSCIVSWYKKYYSDSYRTLSLT